MKKGTTTFETSNGSKLTIDVNIINERSVFGRTEYLVTPVAGSGEVWKQDVQIKE